MNEWESVQTDGLRKVGMVVPVRLECVDGRIVQGRALITAMRRHKVTGEIKYMIQRHEVTQN